MEASHHRKATQARPDGALYRGIPSVAGGVGLRPGDRQEHVGHCRRSGPMDGHPGRCARRGGSVRDRGVPRRVQRSQNAVRAGRARFGSAAGLKYEGVLAESPAPASPVEVLVERYRRWLVADRGLAEATVVRYVTLARVPAAACDRGRPGREPRRGRHCRVLVGGEHSAQRRFDQRPGGRAAVAAEVLYLAGLAPQPLVTLVPPVAGWHDTGVPKAIPAADVQRLLDSCDRTNPIGVRGRRRGASVPPSPARSAAPATPEFAAA